MKLIGLILSIFCLLVGVTGAVVGIIEGKAHAFIPVVMSFALAAILYFSNADGQKSSLYHHFKRK